LPEIADTFFEASGAFFAPLPECLARADRVRSVRLVTSTESNSMRLETSVSQIPISASTLNLKLQAAARNHCKTVSIPEHVCLHEVIDVVLTTLDARDPYTYEHSCRVALFSDLMARELQLPPAIQQRIRVAAQLHDIGKIAIADQVLNKAGRLDRDEMIEIQRHPRIGYNILVRLPTFHEIATIVLHHHERFDGEGYPQRLAGEAIPLESRIIAVADAFDAMTSNRPYRKALSVDESLAEIRRHAGEQFDPVIAASLTRLRDLVSEQLGSGPTPINGQHHAYVGHEDLMHSRIVQNASVFGKQEPPGRARITTHLDAPRATHPDGDQNTEIDLRPTTH